MCYECENSTGECLDDKYWYGSDSEYDDPDMLTINEWHQKVQRERLVKRREIEDARELSRAARRPLRPGSEQYIIGTASYSVGPGETVDIQLTGGQNVRSASVSIEDRKAALRRQQEELSLRIEKLSRIPSENPFMDGDVGRLVKVFPSGESNGYTYAFVYVNNVFYTTGQREGTRLFYSWDQFANWIGEGTWKIERVTQWEDVSA